MIRAHHLVAGILAGSLFAGAHADEPLKIADLAPEGTFLVVGVDRLDEVCARFEKTPLAGLFRSKPMQNLYKEEMEGMVQEMMESLGQEGLVGDDGELELPDSFGLAIFTDLDEETGMNKAFLMGFAEWIEDAGTAGRVFDVMVDQMKGADGMRLDSKDVRGREVTVVETIEDERDGGEDEEFGDFDAMMMFGDPSELAPDLTTTYVVRDKGRLLFANDLLAIDDALSAVDGDAKRSLAGVDAWKQTSQQLGDTDAYIGIFTDPLQDLLSPLFMGPLGIVKPLIGEVFGEIEAYGFAATVPDSDQVSLITAMSILAPGDKAGLPGLMRIASPVGAAPPKLVGDDAYGYGMMNLDFKGLVPLANQIAAAMPMGGEQMEMSLQQFGPMVESAFATLGPSIHVISAQGEQGADNPFGVTLAIPTSDPVKVQPLLALMGPSMNLEPREFKGETIWASEAEGMAMSVAGNWMFMGSPKQVEQMVRSMDDPDGLSPLSEDRTFDAAVKALPQGDVVAWGYTDVVRQYAVQRDMMMAMPAMEDAGGFDEFGPGVDLPFDPNSLREPIERITPEDLKPFIGPSVWTFTADDMGWVMRGWALNPVEGGA